MKLLTEQNENVIVETVSEPTGKSYYIQGVFLQANVQNRNGRIYGLPILEKEVTRYNQAYISQRRALGQLGHPDSPTIELENVSHLIIDLFQEANNFIGKAKILDTPMGKITKSLIDEGVKLGVSSRGMGSLKENGRGVQEVQDDFYLATVDIVADPSAPSAFVQGIMEGKEWVWDNGVLTESKVDAIKRTLTKKKFSEKAMLEAFDSFMKNLSGQSF
jgi:hypothetical protein